MTGAPMPQDGDAILVLEEAEWHADRLRVKAPVAAGRHCRVRGEHVAAGETVLHPGRRLRGTDLGLAASAGVAALAVFRRLRVGVLSTGDELVDPPEPLVGARVYDANRAFLLAALQRDGTEAFDLGIVGDSAEALAASLAHAERLGLDAIITTGGAAQGDADVVRRTSGVQYLPLAIRPGRGLAFAQRVASRPLVLLGLPGNAVAAFVVFQLLARPATRRLGGEVAQLPRAIPLPLASNLDCKPGRVDFQRARLVSAPCGGLAVHPLAQQGSAMLRTISEADALVAIGPASSYRAGDLVDTFLLSTME
jgi:molybdopterin molybdotransferase